MPSRKEQMKRFHERIAELQVSAAAMNVMAVIMQSDWFKELMKKDASKRKKSDH